MKGCETLSRKKLIFSSLVGLALVTFTGCTGSNDGAEAETKKAEAPAEKCQAGKCGEGKCGSK